MDAVPSQIIVRSLFAAAFSFALGVVLGPRCIRWLQSRFPEPNLSPSPEVRNLQRAKRSTPTMGGLLILSTAWAAWLLFGQLSDPNLLVALGLSAGLAGLGAYDDWVKVMPGHRRGLSARAKLAGQVAIATLAVSAWVCVQSGVRDGNGVAIHGSSMVWASDWLLFPLSVLVIVGCSNAMNLTDGLDGLAGGCLVFVMLAMGVLLYASCNPELAHALGMPYIPGTRELVLVTASVIGAVLSFLCFNCHPAKVFMGDTGALPLGGLMGFLAVACRQELLMLIVGGVFVVETASVILQVLSYRLGHGRVFRCAPLHHHFQLLGWPEQKIVVRFWAASGICAAVGMVAVWAF